MSLLACRNLYLRKLEDPLSHEDLGFRLEGRGYVEMWGLLGLDFGVPGLSLQAPFIEPLWSSLIIGYLGYHRGSWTV